MTSPFFILCTKTELKNLQNYRLINTKNVQINQLSLNKYRFTMIA